QVGHVPTTTYSGQTSTTGHPSAPAFGWRRDWCPELVAGHDVFPPAAVGPHRMPQRRDRGDAVRRRAGYAPRDDSPVPVKAHGEGNYLHDIAAGLAGGRAVHPSDQGVRAATLAEWRVIDSVDSAALRTHRGDRELLSKRTLPLTHQLESLVSHADSLLPLIAGRCTGRSVTLRQERRPPPAPGVGRGAHSAHWSNDVEHDRHRGRTALTGARRAYQPLGRVAKITQISKRTPSTPTVVPINSSRVARRASALSSDDAMQRAPLGTSAMMVPFVGSMSV